MTLKFSDLKPGDKINFRIHDTNEWDKDVGTFVRSENNKYWFKWKNDGYKEYFIYNDGEIQIRYDKSYYQSNLTDEELIEELRNRGFKGTLTKTVTQNITL